MATPVADTTQALEALMFGPADYIYHPFLESRIRDESQRCPRFLFRTWLGSAPSKQVEDTKQSVRPRRFPKLDGHISVNTFSQNDLIQAAKSHLHKDRADRSHFSSWTHSWQHLTRALSDYMRSSKTQSMEDVNISIIDTKELPETNVVMHTSVFHNLDPEVPDVPWTFLAFGIISGKHYKTVSLDRIFAAVDMSTVSVGLWPYFTRQRAAIENAQKFGRCFGKYFSLPIAVTLLSFPEDGWRLSWIANQYSELNKVIEALQLYEFPKSWAEDPTIMAARAYPACAGDFERFLFLLRKLI
ncbi:hypothetical protein LTR37_021295 [Vermiconidia calcicola]|uniref:Uncharacterized protein n=1 Tax=Vermiconidia calcicola TaxID=1690605 RepID=A0ACC3MAR9_9PEZI|nr:hypothetical protein LTR37_021295 [Vermiconidia calcicola]